MAGNKEWFHIPASIIPLKVWACGRQLDRHEQRKVDGPDTEGLLEMDKIEQTRGSPPG